MKWTSSALMILVLLSACLPPGEAGEQAPAISPVVTRTPTPFQPLPATGTPTSLPSTPTEPPPPRPARVLIVSIDGFRPEAIELAPMPKLAGLLAGSAYTLDAQTIFPSSTLPAHASMLCGTCPAKHGVTWNDYLPEYGYASGTSLFELAHQAGLRTVMVVGKEKLRQVSAPASTDTFVYLNDRDTTIAQAVVDLVPGGFGLLFVHFPTPDAMGHEYGWLSPEQLSVLYRADEALAAILAALDQAGMRQDTLLIVTADHGGHDTTHGSSRPEDMTIPWILSGPGVRPGRLTTAVHTTDTAATSAWALGLPIPEEWDGLPVLEAFSIQDRPHPAPRCP